MRNLTSNESSQIGGGELTCTVTAGQVNTISCTGTESSWIAAGKKIYGLLAVSPVTVPGIIERMRK